MGSKHMSVFSHTRSRDSITLENSEWNWDGSCNGGIFSSCATWWITMHNSCGHRAENDKELHIHWGMRIFDRHGVRLADC